MTTRVEFLEKVFGPGPGERDAVYSRSGQRYRRGQIANLDDASFAIIERDIPKSAYRVVSSDTPIRARQAETVQENQERSLAQVDPDMSAKRIEDKHLGRKATAEQLETVGLTPTTVKTEPKPKPSVSRKTEDKDAKDIKAMRAEILGE